MNKTPDLAEDGHRLERYDRVRQTELNLGTLVTAATALLGVAAAVGIAGLRVMYQRFYGELGGYVDEVGLSKLQMASDAVAGWLAVLPLLLPGAMLGIFVGWSVLKHRKVAQRLGGGVLVSWVGFFVIVRLPWLTAEAAQPLLTLFGLLFAFLAVAVLLARPSLLQNNWLALALSAFVVSLTLIVTIMWVLGYVEAPKAAASLRATGQITEGKWAMTVIAVPLAPVCISFISEGLPSITPVDSKVPYLLLADHNGSKILLRPGVNPGEGLLRIPSGIVVAHSRPWDGACG